MPFINMYNIIANEWNFCPLPKTWWELEVHTRDTKTVRFSRRADHTRIIFQIDKLEFFKMNDPNPI